MNTPIPGQPLTEETAKLHRFKFAADILQGFTNGIDGDRLGALIRWALNGKVGGGEADALVRAFAAPWLAAEDEAGWKGDPVAEAKKDIERISAAALQVRPLAAELTRIRDKFLMATPDKDHTDYAIITRCIAALQAQPSPQESGARIKALEDGLRNLLGAFDTPVVRRRLRVTDFAREAIDTARALLNGKA